MDFLNQPNNAIMRRVMLLMYGAGIPLFGFVVVFRHRHDLDDARKTYGFLYSAYREETYYYEVIVMLRKCRA